MHPVPLHPGQALACLRPVSQAIAQCELTYMPRRHIDYTLAAEQHRGYAALLASLGLQVVMLAPEPSLADATFVEDAALVFDEVAVICAPIRSRQPEINSVTRFLAEHRRLACTPRHARLEGGDVIQKGRTIYVGHSQRTDLAAIAALRELLEPFGYRVRTVRVGRCLHLSTAACYLGDETFLVNPKWVDVEAFAGHRVLAVPEHEPWAANVLRVGGSVVVPAAFAATRAILERHGFTVAAIDVSELLKAEAGVTCLCLTVNRLPTTALRRISRQFASCTDAHEPASRGRTGCVASQTRERTACS